MRLVSVLCCALAVLASTPATAINTYKDWDGSQDVFQFGCPGRPGTNTFGETITVSAGKHQLNKFTFSMANEIVVAGNSMVVRAEVYQWDGEKATGGALYESEPRTISYNDLYFHKETFSPSALSLTPGRYVLFLSTNKDWQQCPDHDSYFLNWGAVNNKAYSGGTFVAQSSLLHHDGSDWTTEKWDHLGTKYDLAFRANSAAKREVPRTAPHPDMP